VVGTFRELAAKLAAAPLKITAKAGESGRLFGSVTSLQLVMAIKDQFGLDVDRRIIDMPDEVKELGSYEATVRFHSEVAAPVKFDVVSEKVEEPIEE